MTDRTTRRLTIALLWTLVLVLLAVLGIQIQLRSAEKSIMPISLFATESWSSVDIESSDVLR